MGNRSAGNALVGVLLILASLLFAGMCAGTAKAAFNGDAVAFGGAAFTAFLAIACFIKAIKKFAGK